MKRHIERVRRATWSYKQPLTCLPKFAGVPVSDLFVWRHSEKWETFFELIDLPALFEEQKTTGAFITLVLFDAAGQLIIEKTVEITPGRRNTLNLSKIIGYDFGSIGTFCVFHSHTPQCLLRLGSHLTERGYVSYKYSGAPIRGYVHGNLDAIARLPNQSMQLLGGQSIRRREFNIQHELVMHGYYEFGIVNPTPRIQRIVCRSPSASGKLLISQTVNLLPRGSHLFRVVPEQVQQRIVISSHLVMARPLVFHIKNERMDVFHA